MFLPVRMVAKILNRLTCDLRDLPSSRKDTPEISSVSVVHMALCDENPTLEIDDKILKLI